jgi:hypothetical protein
LKIVDGRWGIAIWGSTRVSRVGFGVSPKRSSLNQIRLCERIAGRLPATAGWQPALPNPKTEKEMPDRASLAIRHLVDVQLAAAKTELCVTVVFSELWFLSIPKSLRHIQKASIDYLLGLAVDLCLRAIRNSKVESRKLRGLNF